MTYGTYCDGNGRTARLMSGNGFLVPVMVKERIRSYRLSEFTREHEKAILKLI